MNLFAGKSTTERNKIIAAIVLGFVALTALYFAFGRGVLATSTNVKVSTTPTPRSSTASTSDKPAAMPSTEEMNFTWGTTPIEYRPGYYTGPEAGRNIFAFYEPPKPCDPRDCPPLPAPIKTPPTPTPTPTPPMRLEYITPQNIYAGSGSFRLEVSGDKFDPSARIYFNETELPTQYVGPQKLVANVPAAMIASEGSRFVIVRTPDRKLYSEQTSINVQAPPKPEFNYIGAKLSARGNNDTGYFLETGKQTPVVARLGDVVGGRFRLVSISRNESVFQDVNLPFKHTVKLYDPPPGAVTNNTFNRPTNNYRPNGFVPDPNNPGVYIPYNATPGMVQQENIPGIPNNIPRAPQRPSPNKTTKDDDDDGDGGGL
jgi:hypothetical protein